MTCDMLDRACAKKSERQRFKPPLSGGDLNLLHGCLCYSAIGNGWEDGSSLSLDFLLFLDLKRVWNV